MDNRIILMVEDDPRDQALTLRALKKCNIANEVVVARNGEEALDYLFGKGVHAGHDPRTPQFVLLDLNLPDMNGLAVLQKIRAHENTKGVPVVVFTSSAADEDLVRSYDLGANSFVRKPVDFEQFLEATRQLGLYWLVLNQVVKILIIDEHEVVRDGVKNILDDRLGVTVFGEAGTAAEAVKLARDEDWDVALMDLSLGQTGGLEMLKQIKELRPKLPILVLSKHPEEQFARQAFKAGAAGYLTKDARRADLLEAVNKVREGGRYVSAAIAEKLVVDLEKGREGLPHEALSDREFEVLRLIASGKTVSEIAHLLSLSDKTISTYRARILEKMEMKTSAQLTHYAIQNKLVD